jgi:pyruvate dehydrogenase (quinone)
MAKQPPVPRENRSPHEHKHDQQRSESANVAGKDLLNQIAWEQMMFLGNPQFGCELQPIGFAKAAEAMGGQGFTIREPEEVEAVLDQAFAVDGPVVIEALVDASEPMMPPKMPPDYASNFRQALPETPGREQIEASIAEEPAQTMMEASS